MIKNLAGHLAYLIRWFLTIPETGYNISVLAPNPSNTRANPYIFKLSYVKSIKKYDHRKQMQIDDYKQFSDIDFKEVENDFFSPENIVSSENRWETNNGYTFNLLYYHVISYIPILIKVLSD